jgi:LuxR family maltose regulon positive regulatory protein
VWLRAYRHAQARMLWLAGEDDAWCAAAKPLTAPRTRAEWPFVDVAADLVRGQAALLRANADDAIVALGRAVEGYERFRMPQIHGDPRTLLAWAWLSAGDRARAWAAFEPAYAEVLDERAYGLLLLERRAHVEALLDLVPQGARGPGHAAVVRVLADWPAPTRAASAGSQAWLATARAAALPAAARTAPPAAPAPATAGPLAALTERELEVLAQVAAGASNKHVARDLDLSLHTVKRHVANILDKLDCASRGQAADLYRRHEAARRSP